MSAVFAVLLFMKFREQGVRDTRELLCGQSLAADGIVHLQRSQDTGNVRLGYPELPGKVVDQCLSPHGESSLYNTEECLPVIQRDPFVLRQYLESYYG